MKTNPFFELYIGDKLPAQEFVKIFSDFLVPHAEPMFTRGNVVVSGVQGSGKSMLLSLLKPSVRLEYFTAGEPFPVPELRRKFIGAGVNLAHQHAIDFGLRRDIDDDPQLIELLFADFVNYLVIDSFLNSISIFAKSDKEVRNEVGLNLNDGEVDNLCMQLKNLPVWDGWFKSCESFTDFSERVQQRIIKYRKYIHRVDLTLDQEVLQTRTAIGEPIKECVLELQRSGIIDDDTNVFVDIDQYEELGNISSRNTLGQIVDYRSVINRALNTRDLTVSYRIGTRGHAWRRHGKIMGTDAQLEEERDYKYVDLDVLLRREENAKTDIFPRFAKDVFARRLRFAGYDVSEESENNLLKTVYGPKLTAGEKVDNYNLRNPERALKLEKDLKPETKQRLRQLAKQDLLSAKMGEIWIRQKGDVFDLDVKTKILPWEAKEYWQKERREIVALQIASQTQQQAIWCGADEIIGLSGSNILVFVSINQFIWDTLRQYDGDEHQLSSDFPQINQTVQSIGIYKASEFWINKISQETGRSSERYKFVNYVAEFLAKKLLSDRKVSNPGENGFSLKFEDIQQFPMIEKFLEELSDYGNLRVFNHTTKNEDRRGRKKYYFNPIFCPFFGIPYIRTKEPYYTKARELLNWMYRSGAEISLKSDIDESNAELF